MLAHEIFIYLALLTSKYTIHFLATPGYFIDTCNARPVRLVVHLALNSVER